MVRDIFKNACRIYAGVMAAYTLFQLIGMALTGGLRITTADIGPMSPTTAALMLTWLVAILVTCLTKEEA